MARTFTLGTPSDARVEERVRHEIASRRIDVSGNAFRLGLLALLLLALVIMAVLVVDMVATGWGVLSDRPGTLLGEGLRSQPEETGVFQGLRGTFWIGVFVVIFAFPIGLASAVYLEEYAHHESRLARFIDLNIRNLAGVPSVVYGILGFTVFVQLSDGFYPNSLEAHFGKTTAAAGATLAVLVLPIVIITSAEAIRAVPRELREAGFGVGATRWDVIRTHVLPYAAPGILTGTLLSLARAMGEAAPLILVGAVQGKLGPATGFFELEQLGEKFTAMPILITSYAQKPGDDWEAVTAAAVVVLLVVVLVSNAAAILLRNRFERKRAGR